ncbi:MAG: hypothetical protein RJA70_4654 [Pseudomonadota bacterium]|jgi:hypothetical protein
MSGEVAAKGEPIAMLSAAKYAELGPLKDSQLGRYFLAAYRGCGRLLYLSSGAGGLAEVVAIRPTLVQGHPARYRHRASSRIDTIHSWLPDIPLSLPQ